MADSRCWWVGHANTSDLRQQAGRMQGQGLNAGVNSSMSWCCSRRHAQCHHGGKHKYTHSCLAPTTRPLDSVHFAVPYSMNLRA